MKFISQWGYEPPAGDVMDPHSEVESAGYIPTEKKINNMLMAGERLLAIRADQFDFEDEPDDFAPTPIRNKDFDLVDADRVIQTLDSKMSDFEAQKADQAEKDRLEYEAYLEAKKKGSQTVPDASGQTQMPLMDVSTPKPD